MALSHQIISNSPPEAQIAPQKRKTRKKAEWVGKSPDTPVRPSVRQRILERENSICHICKGEITEGQKWEADHVPPLEDGGENRESMIFPAHEKCHKLLTARQNIERAPITRKKQKHSGARPKKQTIKTRPKAPKKAPKIKKQALPPKQLFRSE